MAAFTITAANVRSSNSNGNPTKTAGVAITAGQAIYFDSDTKTMLLADADIDDAVERGIALNNAAVNQPVTYCTKDSSFTTGFTSTNGAAIYLSVTPGGLEAVAPATGNVVLFGVMKTTTVMNLSPIIGGSID